MKAFAWISIYLFNMFNTHLEGCIEIQTNPLHFGFLDSATSLSNFNATSLASENPIIHFFIAPTEEMNSRFLAIARVHALAVSWVLKQLIKVKVQLSSM